MIQQAFEAFVAALASVLFFDIGGFPFIVVWLTAAALFFSVYLGGVNFRLFRHALAVAGGKFNRKDDAGEVSPLQALFSAVAATVGLGSIAGVSVAIAVGGPGAVFWIVVAGLFGMATKFAEVTLSMKYRRIEDGKVFGGPFEYLQKGLSERGLPKLGRSLALLFAIFCIGGAIGGGNMFQSNQAVGIMAGTFAPLADYRWLMALIFAGFVFLILIGSIKRIAKAAEIVTPLKGVLYLLCALVVIGANIENLLPSLGLILHSAFTGEAATGGFIGMLAMAFRRASFANEAGVGSAAIAHAAARTDEPAREGALAMLEPFFAAFIALLTGLMVVITGAYAGANLNDGAMIASNAFATVAPWFSILLAFNVLIFAYGTTIGWSYYGEIAWSFLFGRKLILLYYILFCSATFMGGIMHFGIVLDLSDLLILGMSVPNIVALYIMRRTIKSEMQSYVSRYKA